MNRPQMQDSIKSTQHVIRLDPQIVARFYGDGNRLGQRPADAPRPPYFQPERWIGSATQATNPPDLPSGGLSTCADLGKTPLRDVLADAELGPALLGESRFAAHGGSFRVLIKLLDAGLPIPFHIHADDAFVAAHPDVYPAETFGKDEAYHFLDAPKGDCSYTHLGLYPGVTAADVIKAMRRSTDHVLELTPGAMQNFGEGFYTRAGMLHRPGTALTLEIQQPSDVYTFFQMDFGGEPLAAEALHPGFESIEAAAEAVVHWDANTQPNLLEQFRLTPTAIEGGPTSGGKVEWVFPPSMTTKFTGVRLTVETSLTYTSADPFVLFVWRGRGTMTVGGGDNAIALQGGGGPVGAADEFFVGLDAAEAGLQITNDGDEPLVAFALFAQSL